MITQNGDIIINNFQRGAGASAFSGFQEFRGLNITDEPGVVFPNKSLALESADTVDGLITCMRIDPLSGIVYGISETKFFKRTTSGVWSVITGHGSTAADKFKGMEIWKCFNSSGSYIFIFHSGGNVDVYDSSTGQSWSDNFKNAWVSAGGSLNFKRPTIVAQDRLYVLVGAGNYGLTEIMENAGETFDPDDSGTYTKDDAKIDYPENSKGFSLEETMGRILIGTTISYDDTKATIFPWDYINDSDSYERPVELGVDTVRQMTKKSNTVYVHAGLGGEIFITNGSLSASPFTKIPHSLSPELLDNPDYTLINYDAFKVWGNKLLIGIGSEAGAVGYNCGVYSVNLIGDENIGAGGIAIENIISSGEDGTNGEVQIGSILPLDSKNYLVSWYTAGYDAVPAAYGVDKISTSNITSDKAFFIDQFYTGIRSKYKKKNYGHIEVQLVKPLTTGDSVKLYYRTASNGSWKSVMNDAVEDAAGDTLYFMNYSATDLANQQSRILDRTLPETDNIQFKGVLNNNAKLSLVIVK